MPRRCSFKCEPSGVTMHGFPNPKKFPDRFKTWVTLVGGKLETKADFEHYRNQKVCDIHFTYRDRNRYNRLNALAVPSLHLTGGNSRQVTLPGPSSMATDNVDMNICQSADTGEGSRQDSLPGPSYMATDNVDMDICQSTDTGTLQDALQQSHIAEGHSIRMEHSYSVISRQDRIPIGTKKRVLYKPVKTKPIHTTIKYLRTEISRLRKRSMSFKARLASAQKLSKDFAFQYVTEHMTKPAKLFIQMQSQAFKKPKGRRFSIEEKILSLSLYKKSPKCYSLLYKYFTLPSAKAMKRLLSQIKISPGINPIIFEKIGKTIKEKAKSERVCSLMFDEMSLTPQIFYNVQKDMFEGFATNSDIKFADHVLVFMVKGLKHNFKQPVAYYFTNCLSKVELKKILKSVIKHVQDCGLVVLNTVCDQSTVNVGAVTDLINETKATYLRLNKEWRYDSFVVNGRNIVPIFDAPHLIKGIRNNLLNKNMVYTSNNEKKIVKWEYYQMVYAADKSYGELRLLHKLTEEHINPEKINKMRVKTATQLLSHSVAVVTEHLTARGDLPQECHQLIDITILLDDLFDSLNGNTLHIPNGKIYKGPVKSRSPHHELWQKAKKVLKSVKFLKTVGSGNNIQLIETTVPSVTNLIKTIEGMEVIWRILYNEYSFDAMLTRNLNQDPLENFFGNIRSYGARNNAPNSMAFEGAFKALLLNNYNTPHSRTANCEEDTNDCLQSLEFFLKEKTPDVPIEQNINFSLESLMHDINKIDAGQRNYVCGWILTKCLKNIVKGCQQCRRTLLDKNDSNINNLFIKRKEYKKKKWLCYPSKELEKCFHDLQNITESFLIREDVPKREVKKSITSMVDIFVDFPFKCNEHKNQLKEYFISESLNILLHSWCRTINRILSGKIVYIGEDKTKTVAQTYYNKKKHYKNRK